MLLSIYSEFRKWLMVLLSILFFTVFIMLFISNIIVMQIRITVTVDDAVIPIVFVKNSFICGTTVASAPTSAAIPQLPRLMPFL